MTHTIQRLRDVLTLQRIQTWPATFLLFFAAYLTAGGELFSPTGLGLALLTLVIHGSSFGHNVVEDYWMDLNDPAKDDHPLTSGRIDYNGAVRAMNPYLFAVELATLGAAVALAPVTWKAVAVIFVMMGAGHWYNDASYSSRSYMAWLPISVTWGSFAAFGWLLVRPDTPPLFWAIAAYAFFRIWFQISVSGRLKEMVVDDEVNELQAMGARLVGEAEEVVAESDEGFAEAVVSDPPQNRPAKPYKPGYSDLYAYALSACEVASGVLVALLADTWWVTTSLAVVLMLVGLYLSWRLVRPQEWDRDEQLDRMSYIEVAYIFALIVLLTPVIGAVECVVLLSVALGWFLAMNRFLYGGASSPDV